MNVDYIIVGLGLAGLAFAEELEIHNKKFVVFDEGLQNASLVAGGTYNPVILKRFTPVWNACKQLQVALPFYNQLELKLNQHFNSELITKKIFSSVADQNNWMVACDKPIVSEYMQPVIHHKSINGIKAEFGYGKLIGTGWIDTQTLLLAYKKHLISKNQLIEERFDYNALQIQSEVVVYRHITADTVVFCEGFGLKKNPFFNTLPLNGTKGETLVIYAPDLQLKYQIKAGVFILPLGNDYYKVGATFNWTDKTLNVTKEGQNELIQKLEKIITVPYTITEQSAGIRPTVRDRRPLVGIHPQHPKLAVLNGLGTRGVMIAPTISKSLFNHLEKNEPIDPEINIKRFEN